MKKHGGARTGAGRPKGQGRYKEPTKPLRIPISMIENVKQVIANKNKYRIYNQAVQAGFPTIIDDDSYETLDLNELIVKHPTATFFLRATGESMTGVGIHPGDILVVDRSINPSNNKIVIAAIDGQLTVKRLNIMKNKIVLQAENPEHQDIEIASLQDLQIWGVVTMVLHSLC